MSDCHTFFFRNGTATERGRPVLCAATVLPIHSVLVLVRPSAIQHEKDTRRTERLRPRLCEKIGTAVLLCFSIHSISSQFRFTRWCGVGGDTERGRTALSESNRLSSLQSVDPVSIRMCGHADACEKERSAAPSPGSVFTPLTFRSLWVPGVPY